MLIPIMVKMLDVIKDATCYYPNKGKRFFKVGVSI